VHIAGFDSPWNGWHALGVWSYPLTVVWIVALINAVNWLDGLDGLAAGVSFIAAATLAAIAYRQQDLLAVLFLVALAGSLLGFLPYNFNPAKLIMGDTGAMLLGYVLATVSVAAAMKKASLVSVGVPLLALGIFIFDSLQTIVSRLRHGQPPYRPDQRHVHHRLLRAGWSHREAVLMIYAISGLLNSAALTLLGLSTASVILSLGVAGLILFLCVRRTPPMRLVDEPQAQPDTAPSHTEEPPALCAL
jgi:UDP-GlcNAc:undecaprenyl-phosphate GlcNAc-1-phosphate transferase